MRSDMHKVIVERPRGGGARTQGKGYRRSWQRIEPEDWPRREGMGRRGGASRRWPTDLLGPLRRFLDRRVGRPWDEVFSEICAEVRARRFSIHCEHLLRHVEQLVDEHVFLVLGWPCRGTGIAWGEPLGRWTWGRPYYVCPESGLLRRRPDRAPSRPLRESIRKELARLAR